MQGSGGQSTGWHADRFASVIQHVEVRGYETIFLGTQADEPRIQSVLDLAGSSGTSLAGRTTIAQLSALLTQCDLLVSIDTGTMHVGRAAGVPMVVLGPSWQRPIEWLPLQVANARVLRGQDRSEAPPGYQLDEIDTAEVIAAVEELSTFYPPSEESRESRSQRLLSDVRA
jgi:ADP-heptose:LPS heptosyltransferase